MVRTVDYESRKRAVLAATINRYITAATPVSSEDIAKHFALSSATIRNIFAELEGDGYLTHPYTSGGRMPTDKGYRYYVDFLMSDPNDYSSEKGLLEEEKQFVNNAYHREVNRLEDILEKTSEIVSMLTHYTSVVSFLDEEDRIFYKGIGFILEQPEFRDFDRIRYLIGMVEDKPRILNMINRQFEEKVKVYIGTEIGLHEINNCALAVSSYRVKNKPSGRLAVLGPTRMKYSHIVSTLEYISEVLGETLDDMLE